ncbi:hypothetical protein [Piscirickettsia salmonis]|uniref:hypothetical protein n=1 Tax=Piscirickettsia salmonis TaxID=1238 RepID=UPI0007C8EE37
MLVNPELKITVARQCELLSVERSGLYYKPVPKVDDTVMMNRIRKRRYLGRYFAHPMMQNRRAKRDDYKPSAALVTGHYVP